jgi:Xaa-Pro aminopeptidase
VADWYSGGKRWDRIGDAIGRHGFDVLLALTPEHAGYLAGQSNFIATHWRIPGIYSVAVGPDGKKAVVSGDFGVDPTAARTYTHIAYRSWTESVDIRGRLDGTAAQRVVASRPGGPIERPAQFDLDGVFDAVAQTVRAVAPNPKRLGVDLLEVDAASVARLVARLPGVELVDATQVLDDLRAIKDPDEIAHLRLAGELTEVGIRGALARITPGMSETALNSAYQIAVHERVIADERFAAFRQAEGMANIGIGSDSPHAVLPSQTLKFDMQVDVAGYHSDIGRTFAIAPTADQRTMYGALRDALAVLEDAVRPGVTFAELYAIGSGAMHRAGFANYSRGHLGHSLGLTQRFEEPPFIAPGEERPVVPNMVLAIEMPYYVYGVGAFQLERMGVVTGTGFEMVDQLPFELELQLPG